MPELPDVEAYRRYAARLALGKKISRVSVCDPRIVRRAAPRALGRRLHGRSIVRVGRHGKNLFLWLDRGGALAMHFGMTGRLRHERERGAPPAHTRLLLRFRSGDRLDYVNQRGLGSVAAELSPDRLKGLYRAMGRVLKEFPRCGGPVRTLAMGGRTGYFCPGCQPSRQSPKKP